MKTFASTLLMAASVSAINLNVAHPHEDLAGSCDCLETAMVSVYFNEEYPTGYIWYTQEGEFKYPANYGLGQCAAWDMDLPGDGCADEDGNPVEGAPDFCGYQWCYVTAECDVFDLTQSALNDDLYYSYANCGFEEEDAAADAGDLLDDAVDAAGDAADAAGDLVDDAADAAADAADALPNASSS